MKKKKAIILGGGGRYGNSWELGYLFGLEKAGISIRNADVIVGTSAGSKVGTLLSSDLNWKEIWEEQIEKASNEDSPISNEDMNKLFKEYNEIALKSVSPKDWVIKMGEISLKTPNIQDETSRISDIGKDLGSIKPVWPEQLRIIVTNLERSERIVLSKDSNVDILEALAASTALPGVWRPVNIKGNYYYDGGSYSMENPDVVKDADIMLILSTDLPIATPYKLDELIQKQENNGVKTKLIKPANEVREVLKSFNFNTMDQKLRPLTALAGVRQGEKDAEQIREFWEQ
jgi:NTE family protein